MPENHLFEYAVVRIVPRVEREEFLNVGVILYCARKNFLETIFHVKRNRLEAFCDKVDTAEVEQNLHGFKRICMGAEGSGPIGKLDRPARFRWLTATRSTVVQTSPVHPGFCNDPRETLERLYNQLVL